MYVGRFVVHSRREAMKLDPKVCVTGLGHGGVSAPMRPRVVCACGGVVDGETSSVFNTVVSVCSGNVLMRVGRPDPWPRAGLRAARRAWKAVYTVP